MMYTLWACCGIAVANALSPLTVETDAGTIVGTSKTLPNSTAKANVFLGIPYAEPPARFQVPQPKKYSRGIYHATSYRQTCIQSFSYPKALHDLTMQWYNTPPPLVREDEDCLYLNVYTPVANLRKPKAVLFWLYGGSLQFGSAALPQYDGSILAAESDVIVVTLNYRINVFGFPGSPAIPVGQGNLGYGRP